MVFRDAGRASIVAVVTVAKEQTVRKTLVQRSSNNVLHSVLGIAGYGPVRELTRGRARRAATFLSSITCLELDGRAEVA